MKLRAVLAICMVVAFAGVASANLVLNPGFEVGYLTNSPYWTHFGTVGIPSIESWAGRSNSIPSRTNGLAYAGYIPGNGGIYQDIAASGASNYVMTFYAVRPASFVTPNFVPEVKLEFLNGSFSNLLVVTDNLGTAATNNWTQLSINAVSPAGTVWVRPTLAFTGDGTSGAALVIDDLDLTSTAIPEPTTATLIGVSLISLLALRRRARG